MSEAPVVDAPVEAPAPAPAPAVPEASPDTSITTPQTTPEVVEAPTPEGEGSQGDSSEEGGQAPADQGDPPKGDEGGEAQGAPEQYAAFTMPEDYQLGDATLAKLTEYAKAQNLSQEQAQSLVDMAVGMSQSVVEEFAKIASVDPVPMHPYWERVWSQQTKLDAEIGGDNLASTMALVRRVSATFASDELADFLNKTGLHHHPELIRFMHAVGKAVSEDSLVTQNGVRKSLGTRGDEIDRDRARANKLYPNMPN